MIRDKWRSEDEFWLTWIKEIGKVIKLIGNVEIGPKNEKGELSGPGLRISQINDGLICLSLGTFKSGNLDGTGYKIFDNGDTYLGYFKDNYLVKASIIYNSSNRYYGGFEQDKKSGEGTYYYSCGDLFEGSWKNDQSEGKYSYYWHDGWEMHG